MTARPQSDSALMWRSRRIVAKARRAVYGETGRRELALLATELASLVGELNAGAAALRADLDAASHRRSVMMAYRRCLNLKPR